MSRASHLVGRFFGSLRPRRVDAQTLAWVERTLAPSELHVWEGLGRADRAESVGVARRLDHALAGSDAADSTWTAAALLHDVGKQTSAYGPIGRVFVTAVGAFVGQAKVRGWAHQTSRVRGRMGRYVAHDDVGSDLLIVVGARPAVAAWAAAHHRPEQWDSTGIPGRICRALARADGEPDPPE